MDKLLIRLSRIFWPDLDTMTEARSMVGVGDVFTFLYSLPLALAGLGWLIATSDLIHIRQNLPLLIFILSSIILFNQVSYFILIEIRTDRYAKTTGSLATMIHWSGIFLLGHIAIWLSVIWLWFDFVKKWRLSSSKSSRWSLLRNLSVDHATNTFAMLVALTLYKDYGGQFPIPGLSITTVIPALSLLVIHYIFVNLIWLPYFLYHVRIQMLLTKSRQIQPILKFILLSFGLPYLSHPFAILAAGLYQQSDVLIFLFFLTGLLLVAILARQLSYAGENNRQQSRQLEKLEQLGRAIINAPADLLELPHIFSLHIPNMFPSGNISLWLSPENVIYHHPPDAPEVSEAAWEWLIQQPHTQSYRTKDNLPWSNNDLFHHAIVIAPILEIESNRPIGGVYLELRALVQDWDQRSLINLYPAVQSLAAQIASALHRIETLVNTLAFQNLTQELTLAGQIQASFLPNQFPVIDGWQIAVTLLPARETSGDYFDVIQLPEGKLGLLIADVADKGVGPALYMALSRTLIRTYAEEYEAEPEVVFFATNKRLFRDTRANLFVTAFYGILDPLNGTLTYCNAGHNPPFILSPAKEGVIKSLGRTGMAMGIEEENTWLQATIHIDPGDVLLLYTDGIPDAQNNVGDFFDDEALIQAAQEHIGQPAHEIQAAILEAVQIFVGDAPQFDDITLMVLVRDV